MAVPAGIVTVTEPLLEAPAASAGIARLPSGTSVAASKVASAERWKLVVDAPAVPVAWLRVESEIVIASPAPPSP